MATVTAHEAKNRFGKLLKQVGEDGEEVVVERHGRPKAVLIPFAAYEEMLELREGQRRSEALRELQSLQRELDRQRETVTFEESLDIAEEISSAAMQAMINRGEVSFTPELSDE